MFLRNWPNWPGEAVKIQNIYALTAFLLLTFSACLIFIPGGIPDDSKLWLLAGLLSATFVLIVLILFKPPQSHEATTIRPSERASTSEDSTASNVELLGLNALIESSNVPMYFADKRLVVTLCNRRVAELINRQPGELVGKKIGDIFEYFVERVPRARRDDFRERQRKLIEESVNGKHPSAELSEYIDNTDLVGNTYRQLSRVVMHADSVTSKGTFIWYFVIYKVDKVKKLP